ncbi:COG1361 S-layer family protein [Natronomonas pharaonis]|nr:hypothetical protein [Natronomonas pharaonis]
MQDPLFVKGSPDLDVEAPDETLPPEATSELTLQVTNDGRVTTGAPGNREVVTTARNVRLEAEGERGIEVETGKMAIGSVGENEPREVPIAVTVPDDVEPGEYEIDVDLRYSYTSAISQRGGSTQDRTRTVTRTVDITVDEGPYFKITGVDSDAQIGDTGTAEVTLENIGHEDADDVQLTLETQSSRFLFGERESDTTRIGELAAGEETTLNYDVTVPSDASIREFAFDGTVRYTDEDATDGLQEGLIGGTTPEAEQTFSISNIDSTLRVGERGDLYGTVTNTGPTTANSAVVRFADEDPNAVPVEQRVAVGALDPGESADFRMPIEMTREAEAVPRVFDMMVTYRNADNELRQYEDTDAFSEIAPRRDQFLVDVEDREIAAGETKLIDVEVTNNLDETATDVEARLFADDPLDSDDDEGFVEELDPGETTMMTFELEAEAGATPKTYPIEFDFRYDDERGNSQLSDTTRVAYNVTEAEDGLPWLLVGVVLLAAGGGFYWYRRK